jgi:hypothetical protein
MMDVDTKQFDDHFYIFRTEVNELERRLASVIIQAFDDSTSILGSFKLLDSFEKLLEREILHSELQSKQAELLWIDYFGPRHVAHLANERVALCRAAEELYYRFHARYEAAGFWKHAPQGKRQLHLFDIDIGRALLAKEYYSGTIQEMEYIYIYIVGTFDARARSSLDPSALAGLALPEAWI